MLEKTLALIKPDAVKNGSIGDIINVIENCFEIEIIRMKMVRLTYNQAAKFYKDHEGKDYFDRLCKFTSFGPLIAIVLEGENVISIWRKMMGDTFPENAEISTIRAIWGTPSTFWNEFNSNAVHGSDSEKSAYKEIQFFFDDIYIPKFLEERPVFNKVIDMKI